MQVTRLVSAEILGRPLNFLLSLMVIMVAAILFVTGPTLINGYAAGHQEATGDAAIRNRSGPGRDAARD